MDKLLNFASQIKIQVKRDNVLAFASIYNIPVTRPIEAHNPMGQHRRLSCK